MANLTHTNIVDTSYNPRHERETTVGVSLELTYDFGNFRRYVILPRIQTRSRTGRPTWISPRSSCLT